jgi:hypothetical protein
MAELELTRAAQTPIITSLMTVVQEGVPRAQASIAGLRAAKGEVAANKGIALKATEAAFRRLVITLNTRRKAVEEEIGTVAAKKQKLLDDRIGALDTLVLAAEDGAAMVACVLEHGSAAEVLVLQPSMVGGLGGIADRHTQLLAPTHIGTRLQFTDTMPELGAALESFGAVDASELDLEKCMVAGAGAGLGGGSASVTMNAEVVFTVAVVDKSGGAVVDPTNHVRAALVRIGGGSSRGGGRSEGSAGAGGRATHAAVSAPRQLDPWAFTAWVSASAESCKILDEGRTVTGTQGWYWCSGKKIPNHNQPVYYEVKINSIEDTEDLFFGFGKAGLSNLDGTGTITGMYYIKTHADPPTMFPSKQTVGEKSKAGDIIRVELDLSQKVVRYLTNGVQVGEQTITDEDAANEMEWAPYIMLFYNGSTISLLEAGLIDTYIPPPTITMANGEADGCVCTYTAPAKSSEWSLEVFVGGEQVRGSPFAVQVKR